MWHRLKEIGVAALVASLATLAGTGTASATVLEVAGETKSESVTITASLKAGTSLVLSRTGGALQNTCTESHVEGDTESPFTGTTVTGAVDALSFSKCERTLTVHKPGTLHVEHIAGTTDGTVSSSGAEVTVGSVFGTLNCKTGEGVDIGRLTGKSSGSAVMDINAVLNCGLLVPSASWKGTYEVTSPSGLGASSPTTLEVAGETKSESVTITASLKAGTSLVLSRTDGSLANTCTESDVEGDTESPFTSTTVTGAVDALSFSKCEKTVTVHKPGTLHVSHIAGTTDGTVSSSGAEVTVGSPFGTLNCKTGAGVDIGRLTGKSSGNAVMDISAVLNCGFLVPSATWTGTYEVTSPSGLGVVA